MTRRHRRGRILLALALCAAVAVSAAGLVLHSRAQPAAATGSAAAPAGAQPSARDRAQLHHLQALLNSGSVRAQGLLAPPLTFTHGSGPVVPAGKTVRVLPGTLHSDGRFGTVRASVSDGTAVTLDLYRVRGHWRLYDVKGPVQTRAKITHGGPVQARLLSATSCAGDANTAPGSLGTRTPVILIHGYDGDPSIWSSISSKLKSMPGIYVTTFDYSQYSTQWVTDPNIGPAFADYIRCVAQASTKAGGPGNVIVVAHSMGGLATRFAATIGSKAGPVAGGPGPGGIAMVITIGTPNEGTLEANVGGTAHDFLCYKASMAMPPGFCDQWTALDGMSVFGPQLQKLPELPLSIPLHAIAGDEVYVYKIWNALGGVPLFGDGIVTTGSALHKRPGWMDDTFDPVRNPLVPGDVSAMHAELPRNPDVIALVRGYINTYLQAHPLGNPAVDLHSVDWARMAIPGSWFTGPPTVQLHPEPQFPPVGMATDVPSHIQGHVPNEPQDVQLGEDGPINMIYGDLGGTQVAAAPVWINASGGGTADAQRGMAYLIYRAGSSGPVFMGVATSEAAWPGGWAPNPKRAGHTDLVTSASFQNGTLVIQEDFYGPSDSTAGPTGRGYTVWSLQGGELSYQNHITQPAAS